MMARIVNVVLITSRGLDPLGVREGLRIVTEAFSGVFSYFF